VRRTVLVIGAAGGVGFEVVRLLSSAYNIIGTVRDEAQAGSIRAQIPEVAEVVALDLSNNPQLSTRVEMLVRDVADLAAVIVCAAVCPNGPVESAPIEALREALEVNFISHVTIFQRSMPALRRSKGRLIFVSSYSGRLGMPFTGAYVASKFALEGIADVMRREVAKWGVEVILIEPGGIKTKMMTRQMSRLKATAVGLSGSEKELYGDLYRQFGRLMDTGFPGATPPELVAREIALALRAAKPKARYRVGADAKYFLALNAVRSDRAMDKICLDIFASTDAADAT
jgi:NAD(P)-dependent dehydrogenase (short-subunit alcohol dehydrogenase family)